jgi:hypothetical protein
MDCSLFLSLGVLRSGSTWAFNVCQALARLLAARRGQPFAAAYMTHVELEKLLNTKNLNLPGPTVIKAHAIERTALDWLAAGRARAICTFRDPRDCVVSMMTFFGRDLDATRRQIAGSFELLRLYQNAGNTLFVRYEQMMADPAGQIERIAGHLNIDVDRTTARQIDRATNLETSRKICEDLKNRPEEKVLRSGDHLVDPITSLHDNHIFSAKFGRWKEELTEAQAKSLTEYFRPWLVSLGYELAAE